MPSVLRTYANSRKLVLDNSVEDNLNTILERLRREPGNMTASGFRDELISACAVALNGLGKIKDPVQLFRNLGLAFEKRGECIYTNTVRNAFNRLYSDAIKLGKQKEAFAVWKSFRNPLTKANAGKFVPLPDLKDLLKHPSGFIQQDAANVLAARKDFPLPELKELLEHGTPYVMEGVAGGLRTRRDFPSSELHALLEHRNSFVRGEAAAALVTRRNFSFSEFRKLLEQEDSSVRRGAARASWVRNDFPQPGLNTLLEQHGLLIRATAANLSRARDLPLRGIHGSRGRRRSHRAKAMEPLRK